MHGVQHVTRMSGVQDGQGFTALQLAAQNRHVETVAKLLDSAGTKEEKGYTALHLAVQAGNADLVRQLLALPTCHPAAKDIDGLTALHWAASKGMVYCACKHPAGT